MDKAKTTGKRQTSHIVWRDNFWRENFWKKCSRRVKVLYCGLLFMALLLLILYFTVLVTAPDNKKCQSIAGIEFIVIASALYIYQRVSEDRCFFYITLSFLSIAPLSILMGIVENFITSWIFISASVVLVSLSLFFLIKFAKSFKDTLDTTLEIRGADRK